MSTLYIYVMCVPCRLTGSGCRGYTTGYSRVSGGGGGASGRGCGAGRETEEEPPVPFPPDEV